MKHWPYIAIIVLLIVVHLLDEKVDRLEKEKNLLIQSELKQKLEQTREELGRNIVERNKLHTVADSLLRTSQAIKLELDKANKKLRNIPGRYNDVKQDSLGKLMDSRASKRK